MGLVMVMVMVMVLANHGLYEALKKHTFMKPTPFTATWRPLETTFNVFFDGGTNANRRDGYGSWEVCWNGFRKCASRTLFTAEKYGQNITNNVAEYLALIEALKFLQSVKDRENYRVIISGDSQLVINQVNGSCKCHKPHLQSLRDRCRNLLSGFSFQCQWRPRRESVSRFGH